MSDDDPMRELTAEDIDRVAAMWGGLAQALRERLAWMEYAISPLLEWDRRQQFERRYALQRQRKARRVRQRR